MMIWKIRMSQKEDCQKYKNSINKNFVKSKHFSPDLLITSKIFNSEIKSLKQYQNKETAACKNSIESACDVIKKFMSLTENVIPFVKDEPLQRSFTKTTDPVVYGLVIWKIRFDYLIEGMLKPFQNLYIVMANMTLSAAAVPTPDWIKIKCIEKEKYSK